MIKRFSWIRNAVCLQYHEIPQSVIQEKILTDKSIKTWNFMPGYKITVRQFS